MSWARLGRVSGASSGRLGGVLALGAVLGPFLDHFVNILNIFWDHFGMVFDLSRHRFFINFVKVFFLFGTVSVVSPGVFGIVFFTCF